MDRTLSIKNEALLYISTSTVVLVAIFGYIFNYDISDMLIQLGVPTTNKIDYFYGFYCIFNLLIPFSVNYISLAVFKRDILRALLKTFTILHIIWFIFFVFCLVVLR